MNRVKLPLFSISRKLSVGFCCSLLLVGCAVKRDAYDVPHVSLPSKFKNSPEVGVATESGGGTTQSDALPSMALNNVLADWWRLFENSELDGLVDRVLGNNPDLKIASLRIAQTQARLDVTGSGFLPEISLPVQAMVEAPENGVGTVRQGGKIRSQQTYQASLKADWRPDIWGERASQYESAEMQLWRATFQRDDVQRRVISDTALNYLEYLALNDRLRVAKETEKVLGEMLDSLQARLKAGDATVTEMEQQKSAVHSVRATIPVLQHQRELVLNRLTSLAGAVPGELKLSDKGLDSLHFPAVLPGVPSALLLRRPDVRVAEARLLAADADIDVARARVLPPLDLSAQLGYGSHFVSQLFQPHSLFWNAIANLSASIFDNGKRTKEVAFARSVHEELVEDYIRIVYNAVREVDDSLSAIKLVGKRMDAQGEATDSSQRAWNYSQESYAAGAVDYLVLLDTERTFHRNLDEWYTARQERYRGLIGLFSALGGGVPNSGNRPTPGFGQRPDTLTAEIDRGVVLSATTPVPNSLQGDGMRIQPISYSPGNDRAGRSGGARTFGRNGTVDLLQKGQVNVVFTATPPSRQELSGIDWSESLFAESTEQWMVELSGVYERSTVDSVWRDLRARFPKQSKDMLLFPRQEGRVDTGNAERSSWYRLYVAKFPDRRSADEFSSMLRTGFVRSWVVSSDSLRKLHGGLMGGIFSSNQAGRSGKATRIED